MYTKVTRTETWSISRTIILVSIKLKDDLIIDFSNNFLHIDDKDIGR